MARWLLVCPHCNHRFAHPKIDDEAIREVYRDSCEPMTKPNFAVEKLACPHCQVESRCRRFHLLYTDEQPTEG
jgi:hypothetical protein